MHLRTLRTRRGWTQAALGQRSRIPQHTISRLERDRAARPRVQTVRALAQALAVDPQAIQFGPPRRRRGRKQGAAG